MNFIIEILVGILGGIGAVAIFRLLNPKTNKQNQKVIDKVDNLQKENEKLKQEAVNTLALALEKINNLEKEKNEPPKTDKELADFFNNRKPDDT